MFTLTMLPLNMIYALFSGICILIVVNRHKAVETILKALPAPDLVCVIVYGQTSLI